MDIFSYIIKYDNGFAPNPSDNICTLACCKPLIRWSAKTGKNGKGDWIMGTGAIPNQGKLIYIMQVSQAITFELYFNDPKYKGRCDNIYKKISPTEYEQIPNPFHNKKHKFKDLSKDRVLISDHFYYFGKNAPEIPSDFNKLIHSVQGHKKISADNSPLIENFFKWLQKYPIGINGEPHNILSCCPVEEEEKDDDEQL